MHNAAGGTSHRLNPGFAMVCSLDRNSNTSDSSLVLATPGGAGDSCGAQLYLQHPINLLPHIQGATREVFLQLSIDANLDSLVNAPYRPQLTQAARPLTFTV
jgi:hypothetical protein